MPLKAVVDFDHGYGELRNTSRKCLHVLAYPATIVGAVEWGKQALPLKARADFDHVAKSGPCTRLFVAVWADMRGFC